MQTSLTLPQIKLDQLNTVTLPSGQEVDLTEINTALEQALNASGQIAINLLVALLILLLSWIISNWLAGFTQRVLTRTRLDETIAAFVGSVARYAFFFTGVVTALGLFGVSLTGMIAVFGALGLAIAFALRGTLSHIAAGLMLIVNRPFKVGDWIQIDDVEGTVKRTTLFQTEINTLPNQRVFIPNSKIWENNVINHTYNEVRMIEVKLPLPLNTRLTPLKDALGPVLEADPRVLRKPEPIIAADKFEQGTLIVAVRVWLKARDYVELYNELQDVLVGALYDAGMRLERPAFVPPLESEKPKKAVRRG